MKRGVLPLDGRALPLDALSLARADPDGDVRPDRVKLLTPRYEGKERQAVAPEGPQRPRRDLEQGAEVFEG